MTSARTVLIVSPYFPPSNLACVHRARHLANHLSSAGWTPLVVCVDERFYEQEPDPTLSRLVSPTVEIIKVPALPSSLSRRVGLGDLGLRAWLPLSRRIADLLQGRPIGAVLITGSPFYPMLMSRWIRSRFNVPVVLDFQDPWVSRWGGQQWPFSKAGLSHRLALYLEPRALRGARFITSVSQRQNEEMVSRYSWLDPSHMAALPIGGDFDDIKILRSIPSAPDAVVHLDRTMINLSYVGTAPPRAAPLFRVLFKALAQVKAEYPALASRIRLHFVGTSNQANDRRTLSLAPLAADEGVSQMVVEIPQRVPYGEAIGIMAGSHGLLLIGSDEPHYTASKIYPALMLGRPFVSLFHRQSSAHALLAAAGGGACFAFSDPAGLFSLAGELAAGLVRVAGEPASLGRTDLGCLDTYSAAAIARRYADIFERLQC